HAYCALRLKSIALRNHAALCAPLRTNCRQPVVNPLDRTRAVLTRPAIIQVADRWRRYRAARPTVKMAGNSFYSHWPSSPAHAPHRIASALERPGRRDEPRRLSTVAPEVLAMSQRLLLRSLDRPPERSAPRQRRQGCCAKVGACHAGGVEATASRLSAFR